jgi:hypothetical protein
MPFKPVRPGLTQTLGPDPDACGRTETIYRRTRNEQVEGFYFLPRLTGQASSTVVRRGLSDLGVTRPLRSPWDR